MPGSGGVVVRIGRRSVRRATAPQGLANRGTHGVVGMLRGALRVVNLPAGHRFASRLSRSLCNNEAKPLLGLRPSEGLCE